MVKHQSSAMARLIIPVALAMTLLSVGTGCSRRSPSPPPTLTVISQTQGLKVYLDDQSVGSTPLRCVPLTKGNHRLRVDASERFETTVNSGKAGLSVVVLITNNRPKDAELSPVTISADTPEVTVSAFANQLGPAPFVLIPATYHRLILTGEANGFLPVMSEVELFGPQGREHKLRFTEKLKDAPGPVPLSDVKGPGVVQQEFTDAFVIGPTHIPCSGYGVSPDGRRVTLTTDRDTLSVYERTAEGWSGRPLFAWRTQPTAVQQQGAQSSPVMSSGLVELGWRDISHVVVAAGELDPNGRVSGEGLGIWVLDATGGPPVRAAWIGREHLGDAASSPKLTGDGKAVVLQHEHPLVSATSFAVIDLDTGAVSEVTADIPHSEFAATSISWPSPDSWSVAYQRPFRSGAAVESDVYVFDLRTGTEHKVFSCARGGLAAGFAWAPDSRKLAIGYSAPGQDYGLLPTDDYDVFLPPQCVVVTSSGRQLASLGMPGKILTGVPHWSPDSTRLAAIEVRKVEDPDHSGDGRVTLGDVLVFDLSGGCVVVRSAMEAPDDIRVDLADTGELVAQYYAGSQCVTSLVSSDGSSRVDYADCIPLSLTPFGLLTQPRGIDGRIQLRSSSDEPTELLRGDLSFRYFSNIRGSLLFVNAAKPESPDPYYAVVIDLSTLAANQPR